MILSLGQFVFNVDTMTFAEIQRSRSWSYGSNSIAQGRDQHQFTGAGEETITIPFMIYQSHGFGNRQSIDDLSEMADSGSGYVLIDGSGYIYGVFAITSLDETRSHITNSGVARKIDGTMKLMRVDDDRIQTDKVVESTPTAQAV
ncbi:phage tail protein [Psychrobacter urativorans]|uniref:Oxidoreductase n=1 Tax=Psychrobacter urativorans TaxID=45610 RepID=A0A0M4TW30_9GAMM|nr:phage tail protein [Psychrobacter urativorans]ALF60311.1 oxidoreductase [Psychrobacter urativorans]